MFTTPRLHHAWFVACRSEALAAGPVPVVIQGTPLVLFRGRDGQPVCLTDRCPHRNVPLSRGAVREGELQCAYHGWRFDSRGACVAVPGLATGDISLKSRAAERWATRELDGVVWVYCTPSAEPTSAPFRFPHWNDAAYSSVTRVTRLDAPLYAVAENILDVPHTAYLHGGLFRTEAKKNLVDVVVRRHPGSVEAEFLNEPRPPGVLGRLLAPGGGVVSHIDRFILPSVAQVEYRLGLSHLVSTSALTPESDTVTWVFAVVTFRLPVPGWVVRPLVTPVAERIFAQDAAMLRAQTAQVRRFGGEKYTSTELDVLGTQVGRLLRQAAGLEPVPVGPQETRVQMWT